MASPGCCDEVAQETFYFVTIIHKQPAQHFSHFVSFMRHTVLQTLGWQPVIVNTPIEQVCNGGGYGGAGFRQLVSSVVMDGLLWSSACLPVYKLLCSELILERGIEGTQVRSTKVLSQALNCNWRGSIVFLGFARIVARNVLCKHFLQLWSNRFVPFQPEYHLPFFRFYSI